MLTYDLVIIGGGTGGLVAAREARRRLARVALIQSGPVGGDCTFTGCIPSKTLLSAAARGFNLSDAMTVVRNNVNRVAATESAAVLRGEGIEVIAGFAKFTSPTSVGVDGTTYTAPRFIVATGARPTMPAIPGLLDIGALTSDTIFNLTERPKSMAILGGGAIGCELAQAFASLGTDVTIVESQARVLPREEPEASTLIADALTTRGVRIRCETTVTSTERTPDGQTRLQTNVGEQLLADAVLVATGRTPSGSGLGLEEIGVRIGSNGEISVDKTLRTNIAGIWAVGDVTGGLQFTHATSRMAWIATANALSRTAKLRKFRYDPILIPWAIFTDPEIGHIGLTESEAATKFTNAKVAYFPFSELDRGITSGDERGFVKLIAVPRRGISNLAAGRLVGATTVGPTGGEMIHEAALVMQSKLIVGRLAQTTHAYPSWSMGVQQAALQFAGLGGKLKYRNAERDAHR